ncbi:MAG: hypothetical protein R3A50_00730 [Saprospiraceae bacterium]|nr:hypothetical protein [Saprospiraceae bacterium]MCB9345546.1 hypothetical protein [Lewinellaceae bacterium]
MNLIFLFLSIFFSTSSPTFTSNEGQTGINQGGNTTQHEPGTKKKDKFGNGDFVIALDGNP